MRERLVVGALIFSAACGGGETTAWVASPFDETTRSAVVGVGTGPALRVFAFDVDDKTPLEIPSLEEGETIELLAYDRSLSSLRLPKRELRSNDTGDLLPSATGVYRMQLDEHRAAEWATITEPSTELASFRTDRTFSESPCDDVEIEVIALSATVAGTAVVETEPGRVWIAMDQSAGFFVFDGTEVVRADVTPPNLEVRDATMGPDGNMYVATVFPSWVYRGRPQGNTLSLEVVTTTIGTGRLSRIAVGPNQRIIGIDRAGRVYESGSNDPFYDFDGLEDSDDNVLFFDGDVLYAGSQQKPNVARFVPGQPVELLPVTGGVLSITKSSFGMAVGTTESNVFVLGADRPELVTTFDFIKTRVLYPWGDGLIGTGNTGAIGIYDGNQTCVTGLQTIEDLAAGATLGDDVRVYVPTSSTDRDRAGGQTPMTVVRRR